MPRARVVSLVVGLAAAAACTAPVEKPKPKIPTVDVPGVAVQSPARWTYHPDAPARSLAAVALAGGGCLLTAPNGERWTTATAAGPGPTGCGGRAEASANTAPADLVAILPRAAGGFFFATSSGRIFQADRPLGPLARHDAPPRPLLQVKRVGQRLVGVGADGEIVAWEEGKGYRTLATPPVRLFDVAFDGASKGHALGLSLPEALYRSDDGGVTWARLAAPSVAARRVGVTSAGAFGVEGTLGSLVVEGTAVRRVVESPLAADALGKVDVGVVASLAAIVAGQAALDGDRFVAIVDAPKGEHAAFKGRDHALARGSFDGRLELTPLPEDLDDCPVSRVALRGNAVAILCGKATDKKLAAIVRRSVDFGAHFGAPLALALADEEPRLAASPDGALLLDGACKADAAECKHGAPALVRGDVAHPSLTSVGAEQLAGPAIAPAFSYDGSEAYFIGKRSKDDRFALYVSHDAGETFSQRSFPQVAPGAPREAPPPSDSDEGDPEEPSRPIDVEPDERTIISPTEEGIVGVTMSHGSVYLLFDDDGRVIGTSTPPAQGVVLGGYGRRVIAEGTDDSGLFESSDGGVTWDAATAPRGLKGSDGAAIVCAAAGCLVGDTFTRVGWGGAAPEVERDEPVDAPAREPHVTTPIACEVPAAGPWTPIHHVDQGTPELDALMRGRTLWSVLSREGNGAAVVAATLRGGSEADAAVSTRSLLGPPGPHDATHVDSQIAGYAAVRAAYAVDAKGAFVAGPMKNVEVAWENLLEGTSGRARIPDAGSFEREDWQMSYGRALLTTRIARIIGKSAFIGLHGPRAKDKSIFALSAGGGEQRVKPWSVDARATALRGPLDVAVIDGKPFSLSVGHAGSPDVFVDVLIRRLDAATAADPWFGASLAPRGDVPFIVRTRPTWGSKAGFGYLMSLIDPQGPRVSTWFARLSGEGSWAAITPEPTLADAGDRPRPCSAADRASTPRVEARAVVGGRVEEFGLRRPILVTETTGARASAAAVPVPTAYLGEGSILHGTRAAPCAAAHFASAVAPTSSHPVVVVSGDGTRGFQFRDRDLGGTVRRDEIEYRPLTCHFDPRARVPDEVWGQRGVSSPRPDR